MFSSEYCDTSNNTCFEEHLCMAASENNKRFLGKATGHNDYMMQSKANRGKSIWTVNGQRLAVIDC